MKTLLAASQFDSPNKLDRLQGLVDYLNTLRAHSISNETLDQLFPEAQESYFVDLYAVEVENGGFLQFFGNTHFDPVIIAYVQKGLEHMGAYQNKALFEEVLERASVHLSGIQAGVSVFSLPKEIQALFEDLETHYDRLNGHAWGVEAQESIVDLNYAYIEKIQGLMVVPDEAYERELMAVLGELPQSAPLQESGESEPPRYVLVIEALCQKYDLALKEITAIDHGVDHVSDEEAQRNEEAGIFFYYFTTKTESGYYYAVDYGDSIELFKDGSDKSLGSLP